MTGFEPLGDHSKKGVIITATGLFFSGHRQESRVFFDRLGGNFNCRILQHREI